MKFKEFHNTGSGNYVADYHYEIHYCDYCDGKGTFDFFLDEMIDYFKQYYKGYEFREFREFIKENIKRKRKVNNKLVYEVYCQECKGDGKKEFWY